MTHITYEQLTLGQKAAFDAAISAIESKATPRKHLTINGPAGTGKTTLTRALIQELIRKGQHGIFLAAPTHQAKKVLSKLAGIEAQTIHSLLKINPNNYEDQTVFEQKDIPDLSDCEVLICDEASMYDTKLFNIILNTVPSRCLIIALGDVAQIRPVAPGATNAQISPFFVNERFTQVSLTEVMRSNAPIIKVATEIRQGGWIRQELVDGQGVHDLSSTESLRNFFNHYFEIVKTPNDLFETRMLAYTNKSVDNLNNIIRKRLYETDEMFIRDEVIVMQEPLIKQFEFEGKKFSEIIFNNGEMVKILDCIETSDMFTLKGHAGSVMLRYWKLDIEAIEPNAEGALQRGQICILSSVDEQNKLAYMLGKAADSYKSGAIKAQWSHWWKLKRTFHSVKPLPCSTIHKSQGMSLDNTFVFTPCIHKADAELAKQLLYVATTRSRNNVYFI